MEENNVNITAGITLVTVPEKVSEKSLLKGMKVKKTSKLAYGEVEVIISNSGTDRHGENIIMEGIDLKQIKKNPVVLWSHDYSSLPIGSIVKIWKDKGNLMARVRLDHEIHDFADKVYKMILKGTIRAVSIGGLVTEWGVDKSGSTDYSTIAKLEMVELSVVPVGAHPDALVTAKSLDDLSSKFLKEIASKSESEKDDSVDTSHDDMKEYIKSLDEALKSLKKEIQELKLSIDSKEPIEVKNNKTVITLGSEAEPKGKNLITLAKD